MTFAAPRNENVDGALDAVLRQQLRRSKAGFFLKVVGNDDLAGMERIAGGRLKSTPKDTWPIVSGPHPTPALTSNLFSSGMYSRTLAKGVSRPWAQSSVARCRIWPMSRVCSAIWPNSPSKDCCLNRYGSSCLVAAVDATGDVTESLPAEVGMNSSLRNPGGWPPSACSTIRCLVGTSLASSLPCGTGIRARSLFQTSSARRGFAGRLLGMP